MKDGRIRVYPIQASDHQLSSMQVYWALSIHDNHYGHVRHIRFSFDDTFVLTAGEDGNIFSFSCLPEEELQKAMLKRAKVPSPRVSACVHFWWAVVYLCVSTLTFFSVMKTGWAGDGESSAGHRGCFCLQVTMCI